MVFIVQFIHKTWLLNATPKILSMNFLPPRGLLKSIIFGESMTSTDYGRFPHLSFAYSEIQSVGTQVPLKNCISSDFCERGQRGGKDLGEVKGNCSRCSARHCY